ncbi:THAP domain-containing protein 2-like isoform X2 [Tachysurus fulvidraco]|uniref:THAP domain-containing protein 2-like isoform X2 n=1 Tax=Tachysurus fulvidraco TaxID=1234273 RepID=UPI001FEE6209|nr:THAP domain-containing protein 2-like isoform X2 [Tachysurus fulvidraco]
MIQSFLRFPSDIQRCQSWTIALRTEGFEPKDRTVLCSCHFRPEDFDGSGQTIRLRQEATPSIFNFPDHLSKPSSSRLSRTSNKVTEESPHPLSYTPVRGLLRPDLFDQSFIDHTYAFDPVKAKEKLFVSQENVEKLQRDLRNAMDRGRRKKKTVSSLLEDLKNNKMLTEELEQKLNFYSGWLTRFTLLNAHDQLSLNQSEICLCETIIFILLLSAICLLIVI